MKQTDTLTQISSEKHKHIVEVLATSVVTFGCVWPVVTTFTTSIHAKTAGGGPALLMVLGASVPLLMLLLAWAAYIPRSSGHLTTRAARASLIAFAGILLYLVFIQVEVKLAHMFVPSVLPSYDETTILQMYGNEWFGALAACGVFSYALIQWLRLSNRVDTVHHQ